MEQKMRKILAGMLTAAMLLSVSAVAFAAETDDDSRYTVTIADNTEGTAQVHKGNPVAMDVTVTGGAFNAVDLYVTYDADLFTYVDAANTDANTGVTESNGVIRIQSLSKDSYGDGTKVVTLNFTANHVTETTTGEFGFQSAVVQAPADADQDAVQAGTAGDSVAVEFLAAAPGGSFVTSNTITLGETEHGTVTVSPSSAVPGTTVTITPAPDDGYMVDQVTVTGANGNSVEVTDNGDGTYSFVMPNAAVTVEVSFFCPSEKFTDFVASAWYHEAVDYVVTKGYFIGTSDTTFEPNTAMTRAMFVQVLANMSGIDKSLYTTSGFSDVADGQWYTAAVEWAAQNGIVLGVGEDLFAPDQVITREQMAVMLYRYAGYLGLDVSGADAAQLDRFPDAGQVSDWAEEAVAWAVSGGIINGTDKGLEPLSDATRAQVAQILMNFDLTK